ncbi:hypothetical protein [Shinella sp. JR1-6]|uniref:hypothetical protein n=1 Tax=Shinella sp. JR1-6 TaxID=2527671 RepID=UPI00102D5092|nr:hypothetical protein [Shinella sp. JR1-6]TAA54651.1 hypothetical protein EXZ48_26875 [Shinella sp. JR1-6]
MSENKPTKRKPLSEPMLIKHGKEWQVCYKAKGKLENRTVTAWVYGPESTFFCEEGRGFVAQLPDNYSKVLDPFPFMVDRVDSKDVPMERLGGSANAIAAGAMYEYLITRYPGGVRLRNGIRIMRDQNEETELERRRKNGHPPGDT